MSEERNTWSIDVHVEYYSLETVIQQFEAFATQMKDMNYKRGGSGNSAASYFIKGPRPQPLTDTEIEKLRDLIR